MNRDFAKIAMNGNVTEGKFPTPFPPSEVCFPSFTMFFELHARLARTLFVACTVTVSSLWRMVRP